MKMLTFAKRNAKEMLRDPLTMAFGLGFPIVLMILLSAIQANVPVSLFEISHLTPGITVFGLSFMSLFFGHFDFARQVNLSASAAIYNAAYTHGLHFGIHSANTPVRYRTEYSLLSLCYRAWS